MQNTDRWVDRLEDYAKHKQNQKKHEKMFGTGDTTVMAYHHQWLYGFTAIDTAYRVLDFTHNTQKDDNLFKIQENGYLKLSPESFMSLCENLLSIANKKISKTGRFGYERFSFLNEEEPYMREEFDRGDNNDGITIIDTINEKYCFMYLHQPDDSNIKPYIPLTAEEYLKIYYPIHTKEHWVEKMTELKANRKKSEGNEKFEKEIEREKKHMEKEFNKVNNFFGKFKLFTLPELIELFPLVYNRVDVGRLQTA